MSESPDPLSKAQAQKAVGFVGICAVLAVVSVLLFVSSVVLNSTATPFTLFEKWCTIVFLWALVIGYAVYDVNRDGIGRL